MLRKYFINLPFLVSALFALALFAVGIVYFTNMHRKLDVSLFWREHTNEVLVEINSVKEGLREIASSDTISSISVTEPLTKHLMSLDASVMKIKGLTADNPSQVSRLDALHDTFMVIIQQGAQNLLQHNSRRIQGQLHAPLLKAQNILAEISAEEQMLLVSRRKINNDSIASLEKTFLVMFFAMFFLLLIAFISIRIIMLNAIKVNADLGLFQSVINSSDDFIVSKDRNGVILSWNPGAEAIFGYKHGEIVQKNISTLILPSRLEGENLIAAKVRLGNYVNQHETQWRHKDGRIIDISVTVSPIRNKDGVIIGACNIGRDITSIKKIVGDLSDTVRQSRDMLDLINDGVMALDANYRFAYVNKRYAEMMHRDPTTLIGQHVWTEFPEAVGTSSYASIRRAMEEQKYIMTEDYYEPLNLWHENQAYPTGGNVFVFVRDISDRKIKEAKIRESEKIYKAIASSIPGTVVCLLDLDFRYTVVEGDLLDRLGYKRSELLGARVQDVLPEESLRQVLPDLYKTLSGETFSTENTRNGVDTVSRFVPFKDDDQKVFAIMIAVIDVSELKQAQREIISLNSGLESTVAERTAQLAFSNKELESFSYSVAHDLRTPLRAVAGYATMLLEDHKDLLDSEGQRMLDLVEKNARKMGALIDDLLAFSKLGRKTLNKSSVDMNELVRKVFTDLNLGASTIGRIIVHNLSTAVVDEALMRQVLVNLISNAIKYSAKNPDACIEVKSLERDGSVTYSISDNGVGFDMAYANKLFGVFQRLHSANDYEGTGVGLAIVQRIISRHNGTVWAESTPGNGATFSFNLPVRNTDDAA